VKPIVAIWVCEKHYNEICNLYGGDYPIMPVYNVEQKKCHYCNETGEHLIDEPSKNVAGVDFGYMNNIVICDGGGKA
jgi:transposase